MFDIKCAYLLGLHTRVQILVIITTKVYLQSSECNSKTKKINKTRLERTIAYKAFN